MKESKEKGNKVVKLLGAGLGLGAVASAIIGASTKLSDKAIHPDTIDYYKHYSDEIEGGYFSESWFHQLAKEEFYIQSAFDYKLHGYYFPNGSKKTMIIAHGITASLWSSVKYMKMFYDRGYNIVIYDHRNHGLSGGDFTTLGVFEKMDGKMIIDFAKGKGGQDISIGLHGESMGAAIVMMMASVSEDIDFIIEDCGYTKAKDVLTVRLKEDYSLPAFPVMHLSEWLVKKKYKFSFSKESPLEVMKHCHIPVLFIHGGEDSYVPTDMVNRLYEAKVDQKDISVFQNARHAESFIKNQEEYVNIVNRFMDKYGF